ncbi:hypothetical protein HPB47_003144 [Ixodes persulcatus]|uniref:Uncharacterized protein n=1 Tax=Ixodes persulcatus TaxID=34615 RepID=A0AC60PK95_IXOPE|nr:hypothetical protein HPB47_003144 [Ixodes persulcatus]
MFAGIIIRFPFLTCLALCAYEWDLPQYIAGFSQGFAGKQELQISRSFPFVSVSDECVRVCIFERSGMEQVWQAEFQKLFSQYVPQSWYLLPVVQRPIGVNWQTFVDSAKVRFCCEECGHGWTSMKGRISFWFLLTGHGEGLVTFKLYGQQCDKCKVGRYEPAMWYPEEVVKVLVNIYNRVGQVYYGFQQPPIHKNRRPGKPRNPHNADLCQACRDGVCSERRRYPKTAVRTVLCT